MHGVSFFEQLQPNFNEELSGYLLENNVNIENIALSEENSQKAVHVTKEFINKCTQNVDKILLENKDGVEARKFNNSFQQVWGESIKLSEVHECLISEIAFETTHIHLSTDDKSIKEYVLTKLLGNAIRTYQEIILLMKNGYPYGAISLTRNLFELSIITRFIQQENDEVSKAYYKSSDADVDYNDKYAWARPSGKFSKNERITIQRLREISDFDDDKFKNLYTIYCNFSHSAPQIVNNDVDTDGLNIYAGPKTRGINAPGPNAAAFICDILLNAKLEKATPQTNWKIFFCLVWEEFLCESYNEAANKLEIICEKQKHKT